MEDGNPPVTDPTSSDNQSATTVDNDQAQGSTTDKTTDKSAEAYRQQQSRADKAQAEASELSQRLEFTESVASEYMRDKMISEFLTENKSKYPDVSDADLKELATSPDDMEAKATFLQKKSEDIKQSTLASVREVPEHTMTEAEKKKALSELKPSPSSFQDFLRIRQTKVRK